MDKIGAVYNDRWCLFWLFQLMIRQMVFSAVFQSSMSASSKAPGAFSQTFLSSHFPLGNDDQFAHSSSDCLPLLLGTLYGCYYSYCYCGYAAFPTVAWIAKPKLLPYMLVSNSGTSGNGNTNPLSSLRNRSFSQCPNTSSPFPIFH